MPRTSEPESEREVGAGRVDPLAFVRPGIGWIPDTRDDNDYKAGALLGAARNLPNEAMRLVDLHPGIEDQGNTSSCVGQAIGAMVDTRARAMGRLFAPRSSGIGIYKGARALMRSDADVPLDDAGSSARFAMRFVRDHGAPLRDDESEDPDRVNAELLFGEHVSARGHRIHKWWRVDAYGRDRVNQICQAIAKDLPVVFGTTVDEAFGRYDGSHPLGRQDARKPIGGHMMGLLGYTTDGAQRVFVGANSWSQAWGRKGFFLAGEAFVTDDAFGDCYVLQVE